MKKLSLLLDIMLIIACQGIAVSDAWGGSVAQRLVAPARSYITSARSGSRQALGQPSLAGMVRQTPARFYSNQPMRGLQADRCLLPIRQGFSALPPAVSQPSLIAPAVAQRFYGTRMQRDGIAKEYKKKLTPIETARTAAAIEQSKKEIEAHKQIIAELTAKIEKAQQKNINTRAHIATYTTALEQLLERLKQTEDKGTVFMQRIHNPKIFSLQDLIKRLEQIIVHEEHHIKSLQATLDHQKKLKAEAAQVPEYEAARNAVIIHTTQQKLLKGNDIVAIAADARETAELKQRLQTASIKDKELLAYHFITKDNIGSLAQGEHGSELLQELVQSANAFALDARVIRETIVIQALDESNIVTIAQDPHGVAFLNALTTGHIGKNKISELLVDDITDNNIDQIADNEHGREFLKGLWDTDNAYVRDHIKDLNRLQLINILQKPRTTPTQSIFTGIKDYVAAWIGSFTSDRVQQ